MAFEDTTKDLTAHRPHRHRLLPLPALHAAFAAFLLAAGTHARAFSFDDVANQAAALARSAYRAAPAADPELATMSYDELRAIRFKPERARWRGTDSPFELQFFPRGRGFAEGVRMFEIDAGRVQPIDVPASDYTSGTRRAPVAGAAGWRLHYPLNGAAYRDEVIAFLGASYFRAVAAGLRYGASARGLAVDTAGGQGEEFPAFTSFWFERPHANASEFHVFALLDGPRVSGAYAFVIRPGKTTVVDVRARLYLRAPVATLGIAPLTSMFFSGENQPPVGDYRPEVHDSDGMQIATGGGEWIWRPLIHPPAPFVTSFALRSPRGFGLMQRDRDFRSYEDLETRSELRPSIWVEPLGDWGAGRVELLQFHIPDETHDNIVAYWVPERLPVPGAPLDIAWRMHWAGEDAPGPPAARVVQTRAGMGYRRAGTPAGQVQFHVDFSAPAEAAAAPEGRASGASNEEVEAVATGNDNVRGLQAVAYPNPVRGGWRVSLEFERIDVHRPVELRMFLRRGGRTLSETWSYALAPE